MCVEMLAFALLHAHAFPASQYPRVRLESPEDAENPSTWDGSTPAIWLSVSLIGHMCIMQRLFADGRIPYGSALGKCVKVVTGHSAGFL